MNIKININNNNSQYRRPKEHLRQICPNCNRKIGHNFGAKFFMRNFATKRLEFSRGCSDPNFLTGSHNLVTNIFLRHKILSQTFVSDARLRTEYFPRKMKNCNGIATESAIAILLFSCSDFSLYQASL